MYLITVAHILIAVKHVQAFWPPSYQVHLNQSETFIISDMFDNDDAEDFSADDVELIKEADVERYLHHKVESKFYRLHQFASRRNRAADQPTTSIVILQKPPELPYEKIEYPEYAGFVNNRSELDVDNHNVFYANEMVKATIEKKIKSLQDERNSMKAMKDRTEESYDYNAFKNEYAAQLLNEKKSINVLKYEIVPEEESFMDAAKNIVQFKKAKNCTKEEMKGIGLVAAKCFFQDLTHIRQKKGKGGVFKRFLKFSLIWFMVYAVIAIPFWCTKGWCCCCCRCKFCKPRKRIDEVKKFLADNPLGTLHIGKDKVVTYTSTVYEEMAQRRLEQALMKL